MSARTVITLVCDLCTSERQVETHELSIDKDHRELEACAKCWADLLKLKTLARALDAGRTVKPRPKPKTRRLRAAAS